MTTKVSLAVVVPRLITGKSSDGISLRIFGEGLLHPKSTSIPVTGDDFELLLLLPLCLECKTTDSGLGSTGA